MTKVKIQMTKFSFPEKYLKIIRDPMKNLKMPEKSRKNLRELRK